MSFHGEILTPKQRKALRLVGPRAETDGLFLAGGTAIALHLGHRRSVDLDWFSTDRIRDPLHLAGELRDSGIPFASEQTGRGTLHGTVYGVRVSYLEFRYRMLDPLVPWQEFGCCLAGLRDLVCMKLSAITQRGAKKDFVDLFALGQHGFFLPDMLEWYRTKFDVKDVGHVLYALAYFEDADAERMPRMVWKADWKEIKKTIAEWVRAI